LYEGGVLMSDQLRILGMASGLDTETMVKQLIKAESVKVDKVKQDKQIIQWKQDLYREIIGDLATMKSTYFELLKPETNVLSKNNYSAFDVAAVDVPASGTASPIAGASATAGVGAVAGIYTVTVNKLAIPASKTGTALSNGVTKATKLSDTLVGMSGDTFDFNITYGTTTKSVSLSKDDTIEKTIQKISDATSGNVIAKYSELTRTFTIETQATGLSNKLKLDKDISFLNITNGTSEESGDDAQLTIDPPGTAPATPVTRPTNNFTIDGISYTLSRKDSTTNITVSTNTQKAFDKIKGFIDKYNEIVDKVNNKISEKKQYAFKPLTDEQKKEMEEEDIKKWEERAKEGLLKNDSSLQNMLSAMRSAFFQEVEGAGIYLKDLGLSTSADYSQRGKIVFDSSLGGEQKLKDMLATRGEQVTKLFMQTSTKVSSYDPDLSSDDRKRRDSEQGIFQRVNDILQDYVRTTRNDAGKKGFLIEKAGIKGEFSEFNNLLYTQITDKDKMISSLSIKLADKENRYYAQFAKLEQAMNSLNSQSSWLAQQLGSGM
jgi:flagellar hook-associated protein 2